MKLFRALYSGTLLVATVTSCVAPAKVSDEKDANGKKIEYVYITRAGSNIPIKVRKDSLSMSDSDTNAQDKAYTDLQRDAPVSPPPGTGGR